MEDVRLGRADGRQPAVAEQLGTNHLRLGDFDRLRVLGACGCRFTTIGGVADNGTFRSTFGQTQLQADGTAAIGNATQLAEYGSTEDVFGCRGFTCVGSTRGRRQLIAPLVGTIRLATIGHIGSGHLLQRLRQTIDGFCLLTFKQIHLTALARLQTEVGVQTLLFLVAVNDGVTFGCYRFIRQLPGFLWLVLLVVDLVVSQVDGCICGVIQLYPRVWKFVNVIHRALDIRLHQFVNHKVLSTHAPTT